MCGRFVQFSPSRVYADMFGILEAIPELPPRYNVAPSQAVLAARVGDRSRRELVPLRWGLVPGWSKGPDPRYSMINARAETAHEKPAYRAAFRYRRCLVPTEGFYEWKAEAGAKQPYFIRMRDKAPFALAGLWEHWQDADGNELESCAVLVTEANEVLRPIHDRMPVILLPGDWAAWLDPKHQDVAGLRRLLQPCDPAPMEAFTVSRRVNNARHEGAELTAPLSPTDEG